MQPRKPKPQQHRTPRGVVCPIHSFTAEYNGTEIMFTESTRVREGHPVHKANPDLFRPERPVDFEA